MLSKRTPVEEIFSVDAQAIEPFCEPDGELLDSNSEGCCYLAEEDSETALPKTPTPGYLTLSPNISPLQLSPENPNLLPNLTLSPSGQRFAERAQGGQENKIQDVQEAPFRASSPPKIWRMNESIIDHSQACLEVHKSKSSILEFLLHKQKVSPKATADSSSRNSTKRIKAGTERDGASRSQLSAHEEVPSRAFLSASSTPGLLILEKLKNRRLKGGKLSF